jgi:hypothetical protein
VRIRRCTDLWQQLVRETPQRRAALRLDHRQQVGVQQAHDAAGILDCDLIDRFRGQVDPADPATAPIGDDLGHAGADDAQMPPVLPQDSDIGLVGLVQS